MAKRKLLTQTAYAKHRGVAQPTVSNAVRTGRIPTHNGRIDPVEADEAWAENTRTKAHLAGADSGTLLDARVAYETARARLTELTYEERRADLVSRAEVEKVAFETARRARELLLTLPDRILPVLDGLTDAGDRYAALTAEVDRICAELSSSPLRPRRRR